MYLFPGTNLLQTAAHEFGHSLGLSHSDKRSALMAPFYRGFTNNVKLASDDIEAIQELYGEKTTEFVEISLYTAQTFVVKGCTWDGACKGAVLWLIHPLTMVV